MKHLLSIGFKTPLVLAYMPYIILIFLRFNNLLHVCIASKNKNNLLSNSNVAITNFEDLCFRTEAVEMIESINEIRMSTCLVFVRKWTWKFMIIFSNIHQQYSDWHLFISWRWMTVVFCWKIKWTIIVYTIHASFSHVITLNPASKV